MASEPRFLPPRNRRPSVPAPTALSDALSAHASLRQLHARIQASQHRLTLLRTVLPGSLMLHLQAGPLDEETWTVLVANAAVAAKLRQLLPRMETTLMQAGCPQRIRLKLQRA